MNDDRRLDSLNSLLLIITSALPATGHFFLGDHLFVKRTSEKRHQKKKHVDKHVDYTMLLKAPTVLFLYFDPAI